MTEFPITGNPSGAESPRSAEKGDVLEMGSKRIFASIPVRVANQSRISPSALAVVSAATQVSYRELDEQANRLANHLRRLGAGPGSCVAFCLNRSVELVIAALAVMKTGGAYLPLDPTYPAERLAFIVEDSRSEILIAEREIASWFTPGKCRLLRLDVEANAIAGESNAPPIVEITPESLVYIIYTSGSTGQPKGVEVSHESLLNLIDWHVREFQVTAADRATQIASPGFDAAVWEIWPYLTSGASIHFVDEDARFAPEMLRDWLLDHRITISFAPTALVERLIHLQWPRRADLRYLLAGADVLRHYPPSGLPFCLVNNYGPTECTVVTTSCTVPPGAHGNGLPPIGRPISNAQAYILSEMMAPVPAGEMGELYVGGILLAQGYRGRPKLTMERFIRNPFSKAPNDRIYRTGDLVRELPGGQLEFLGRRDEQIKLRGFRLEPNEIVAALGRHPAILESALVATDGNGSEKRLAAYIVLNQASQVTDAALQDHLRVSLPEYMVPALFVRLASLPRTPNGKVDRDALPSPNANSARESEFIAPRTPVEVRLSAILASLMGLDRVGVNENFFLLGGHSLLGTQVISRVRDAFGVELPLRSLFDAPTVADLSSEIERIILKKLGALDVEPPLDS
jgi:amino acid adenylation domain-containing protein